MQSKRFSHEELQKNITDLKNIPEHCYLYHEGNVYYSFRKPGARDATGWVSGGEVFNRTADGYVHFKIRHSRSNDWEGDSESWLTYKVKEDGTSELE